MLLDSPNRKSRTNFNEKEIYRTGNLFANCTEEPLKFIPADEDFHFEIVERIRNDSALG